jgi:hypothetical protein
MFEQLSECRLVKIFGVLQSDGPFIVTPMWTVLHMDTRSELWRDSPGHIEREFCELPHPKTTMKSGVVKVRKAPICLAGTEMRFQPRVEIVSGHPGAC